MTKRRRFHLRRARLALLGLLLAGCARGGGGGLTLRNPMRGSMKESLSRLQHENQELEESLASAKGETRRLAGELEHAEGRVTDLANRLDRFQGRVADTGRDAEELADQYDPRPNSGRSTRTSGRSGNKAPFTQIPNRIDVPTPPESTASRRDADDSSPLLSTPPVDYFDFDKDGGGSRSRPRSNPVQPARPASSGTSWAPVAGDDGRTR